MLHFIRGPPLYGGALLTAYWLGMCLMENEPIVLTQGVSMATLHARASQLDTRRSSSRGLGPGVGEHWRYRANLLWQ